MATAQPQVESIPTRNTAKAKESGWGGGGGYSSPRSPEAISPDSATPTSSLCSAKPGSGHVPLGDL